MAGQELGQLAWNCRRGMKELDLMLRRYLDQRWSGASADEKAVFEAFLELPDPVIAGYLLGGAESTDPEVQGLVEALRAGPPRGAGRAA
jgi:antitoxin CptB